jgi:hypothetical protein
MGGIMSVTVTQTTATYAVNVDGSHGQYIRYSVDFLGAQADFAFSSVDSGGVGHPLTDSTKFAGAPPFVWKVSPSAAPAPAPGSPDTRATSNADLYVLELSRLGATQYTISIDLITAAGSTNLKSLMLYSTDATDTYAVLLKAYWT